MAAPNMNGRLHLTQMSTKILQLLLVIVIELEAESQKLTNLISMILNLKNIFCCCVILKLFPKILKPSLLNKLLVNQSS